MLMLGFLASASVNPAIASTFQRDGQLVSLAGGVPQFVNQAIAIGVTIVLAMVMTFVLLKLINAVIGLRVQPEQEHAGLDVTEHGESAYN
jgi:Amt family ammonium transporter